MTHFSRRYSKAFLCLGLILSLAVNASAATPEQVEDAIRKAKEFLYKSQLPNGQWPMNVKEDHWNEGGYTALPLYALLAAGDKPKEPRIKKAIEWLLQNKNVGTYTVGIRCNVWNLLPRADDVMAALKLDATTLFESAEQHKPQGMYGYQPNDITSTDHSNSQYGVLGMWAAANASLEIPPAYWQWVDKSWREAQQPDGGWYYSQREQTTTASMTAAGVASLFIAFDQLYGNLGIDCKGNVSNQTTLAINHGLDWMSDNFSKVRGVYTWYGVERIGVASGYKYFGTADWFKQGADTLIKSQKADGSWDGYGTDGGPPPNTAFGILFLVRGRAPVVMNKLQYSKDPANTKTMDGNWNERPRDAANFTKWLGKQLERDFNWQSVRLDFPVDDLHDAPILYISGNEKLNFSEEHIAKIKLFIEQGGLVFGNADCGSTAFSESFKSLGSKMFPYEFRELPATHVIYTNEQYPRTAWKGAPSRFVQGMTNGARELMLLLPSADHSRNWQTQTYLTRKDTHELMADIFQYAIDKKELRYKGQSYALNSTPLASAKEKIKVARLEYGGNWNPEPGGWERLSILLTGAQRIGLDITPIKLGDGKLSKDFPIAHFTGTAAFHLSDPQRDELRAYLAAGGTLLIDSTGGQADFAASCEKEIPALLPPDTKDALHLLTTKEDVYSSAPPLTAVGYRPFARKQVGIIRTPLIKGVEINGRIRVFYSAEDLSVGLVGQAVDGIYGYTPESATELVKKIVFYAAGRTDKPTEPAAAEKQ